ncbi:hypothetical protein C9374_013128 [Naegleria lovaniensis]|uniref:Auxin efflux carrier n=1 Tax=Naegleria lovaniensis TaxID=51637 RepID=A0AA88GC74_NAELO|nr:uncharacterized protein C9374_013128 [Naegleria lovaniensis]KAG2372848.1 hypothetical protein C9374_013128 [Naegleria lovaniensis]
MSSESSPLGMTLLTLFLTSLSSTFEVLLECSIGFLMARVKMLKLLNKDRIRFLSKLWFNLFIPSLFFIGISQAFSAEVFRKLYMIFVFGILLELLGILFGKLLFLKWLWREKLSDVSRSVLNLTLVCHTSVSLPLVFLEALCKVSTLENNPVFNMTYAQAHDSSVTASSVFIIPTELIFYTYGYHSFRLGAERLLKEEFKRNDHSNALIHENESLNLDPVHKEEDSKVVVEMEKAEETMKELQDEELLLGKEEKIELLENLEFQNPTIQNPIDPSLFETTPNSTLPMTSNDHPIQSLEMDTRVSPSTRFQKLKFLIFKHWPKCKEFLVNVLSPPLVSIFLAIILALIPPAKEFLIVNPPIFVSSLKHICETFAQAVSPAALIVLGGNLALTLLKEEEETEGNDDRRRLTLSSTTTTHTERVTVMSKLRNLLGKLRELFRVKRIHPLAIAISVVVKLVVFPLIGIGIVAASVKLQILPSNDPILILVVLIQFSMPMSMSLAGLSSLNKDYGQEEVCELLLWHYLLCPFTLSLFSTWFLSLSCQFLDDESASKLCRTY